MLSGEEHNAFDVAFFLEIEFESVSSCRFFISAETNYIKSPSKLSLHHVSRV